MRRPKGRTEIEVTVASGACVSVMPVGICGDIDIIENELSRNGAEYEVANGATIPNLGERKCEVMTVGSLQAKRITFQVADVHKPLLSISGCQRTRTVTMPIGCMLLIKRCSERRWPQCKRSLRC